VEFCSDWKIKEHDGWDWHTYLLTWESFSNKTGHKLEQQLYYYLPDRISTNNPNIYPFAENIDSKLQIFRTF
jgi:hypothetical protein